MLFCRCCWQSDEIHAQEKSVWTKLEWISMKSKDRCLCTTHCWACITYCYSGSSAETSKSFEEEFVLFVYTWMGDCVADKLHVLPWCCDICFFVAEKSISNSWEKKVSVPFCLGSQICLSFFQLQGFLGSVNCSLYSLFLVSLLLLPLGAKICLFIQAFRAVSFVYILM